MSHFQLKITFILLAGFLALDLFLLMPKAYGYLFADRSHMHAKNLEGNPGDDQYLDESEDQIVRDETLPSDVANEINPPESPKTIEETQPGQAGLKQEPNRF